MKSKSPKPVALMFVIIALLPLACSPSEYGLTASVSPSGSGTVTPASGGPMMLVLRWSSRLNPHQVTALTIGAVMPLARQVP